MRAHRTIAGGARRAARNALVVTAVIASSTVGTAALVPAAAGAEAAAPRAARVKISARNIDFGFQRVGTVGRLMGFRISNTGNTPLTLKGIKFQSGNRTDFIVATGCFPTGGHPTTIAPGKFCTVAARFVPRARTTRTAILRIDDSAPGSPRAIKLHGVGTQGYYQADTLGSVARFGDARFKGALTRRLSAPIVALTTTPAGAGYWLLGADGGVFPFGTAKYFGSTPVTAGCSRSAARSSSGRPVGCG
jgi:hypothetical protein